MKKLMERAIPIKDSIALRAINSEWKHIPPNFNSNNPITNMRDTTGPPERIIISLVADPVLL